MKKKILLLVGILNSSFLFAQNDTIYTNNNKIIGTVREITEDAIKFSYPDEDFTNSIYKNIVEKIVFKNGRVQTFSESTSFKRVRSVEDFENVSIAQVENEVKGLFKISDVNSKSKGTTTMSNQKRVQERAYRKLKIEAAMMGANVIYLTHQRSEGNKQGGYWQSGSAAETNLSGVAYTNKLPDYNDFVSKIENKKQFETLQIVKLWGSASDFSKNDYKKNFFIESITNENGLIMLKGKLDGFNKYTSFRVVSFNNDTFNIFFEDKSTSYNITIKF